MAITCGPQRASKCLTEAAAVGADRLIHIVTDADFMDSCTVQSILSSAIERSSAISSFAENRLLIRTAVLPAQE